MSTISEEERLAALASAQAGAGRRSKPVRFLLMRARDARAAGAPDIRAEEMLVTRMRLIGVRDVMTS